MDQNEFTEQVRIQALTYIQARKQFIRAGRETPELAALITEKYCAGLVTALQVLAGKPSALELLGEIQHALEELDPQWQQNCARRRQARPARLML